MRVTIAASAVLLPALVGGCAAHIDDVSTYENVPMEQARVMPTEDQLDPQPPKVVVFEAQLGEAFKKDGLELILDLLGDSDNEGADSMVRQSSVGYAAAQSLRDKLDETGAELIDPLSADALRQRLVLEETGEADKGTVSSNLDYAFTGLITDAISTTSSERIANVADSDDSEKDKKKTRCTYYTRVRGKMTMYDLPSLSPKKKNGFARETEKIKKVKRDDCPKLEPSRWKDLLKRAASQGVAESSAPFQNELAPKAYVLEHRRKEDKNIFKVSLGEKRGFYQYNDVIIYRPSAGDGGESGKKGGDNKVAKGTVTTEYGDDYAWILVEGEEAAARVRRGHYAKVHYK